MKQAGLQYENELKDYKIIAGVDEVGRGCVAGPVAACAVIMPQGLQISGVYDSKALSEKKRSSLSDEILKHAVCYSIKFIESSYIDKNGIANAVHEAMRTAVLSLDIKPGAVLIDGNAFDFKDFYCKFIIGGDKYSHTIAAASILAKVARDSYMKAIHEQYPMYGFDKHKGYGTKAHFLAIEAYGLCEYHRKSFLKNYKGD